MTQERQEKQYQPFNPNDYQKQETNPQKIQPPEGIESILEEIDKAVSQSNLSEEYKQEGGQ